MVSVKVTHDFERQILEIPSLIRVMNNYYYKKNQIEKQIRPLLLKRFQEGLKTLRDNRDWLFTIPSALDTLSQDLLSRKDSFRFPDSIILFEAWMNLGMDALYPQYVLQFKFPGFLKGEKNRYVFQFIYASSRGFGFPIYFGPEFYEYYLTIGKILEPLFQWGHTVCHRINQAIFLIGDKRLKLKRHHPGEFESVIISEYENNVYKGIDTLFHGYFTKDPHFLGFYESIEEALEDVYFSYTIGDHAMSVHHQTPDLNHLRKLNIISFEDIKREYDIDFYSYIKNIMNVRTLLITRIAHYKRKRKELINQLKFWDKLKFRFEQSKSFTRMSKKLYKKYPEIQKYNHYKNLLTKLLNLLWVTPLYTHTIHSEFHRKEDKDFLNKFDIFDDDFVPESADSIFLHFIKYYESKSDFKFEERDIISIFKKLRDHMAKMWLYFKERQFKYALQKLNEISNLKINEPNYNDSVRKNLNKIIPIISLFEIFSRPLAESVYPESIPQTKRVGAYFAQFFASKYNPIGFSILKLFNRFAYRNWGYYITHNDLDKTQFFRVILRLPIWKHIPLKLKEKILASLE